MLAPEFIFRGHHQAVNCVKVFSVSNSTKVISGDAGGNIFCWDLNSKKCVKSFRAHDDSVLSVNVFSSTDVISSSKDGTIKIWHLSNFGSSVPSMEMYTGCSGPNQKG